MIYKNNSYSERIVDHPFEYFLIMESSLTHYEKRKKKITLPCIFNYKCKIVMLRQ